MELRDGIPLIAAVEELWRSDQLADMLRYSDPFLASTRSLTRLYRWGPETNPLRNWGRRWEYPFVWQRLQRHAAERGSGALSMLDAGSGVTFFRYNSLHGRCEIRPEKARTLLSAICQKSGVAPAPHLGELDRLNPAGGILTTDRVRETEPDLLPWKCPLLKSFYDLFHGSGWTGGFFFLTCYCVGLRSPG